MKTSCRMDALKKHRSWNVGLESCLGQHHSHPNNKFQRGEKDWLNG
uniref:Uncharacterized protein n=1 Tax=Elaeophora elaphi TaxID=1147741 RepID=A0A0R3S334_9BILA